MDQPTPPRRATIRIRQPPFQRRCIAEQELIERVFVVVEPTHEITNAARAVADARGLNGGIIFRSDGVWPVLTTDVNHVLLPGHRRQQDAA